MRNQIQDLRYALRLLRKNSGFAAVAIAALAIGIGANTTIFTLLNATFLRPVPVPDPGSLIRIYRQTETGRRANLISHPDYLYYREHNAVFSGTLAYTGVFLTLGDPASAYTPEETVVTAVVSENYFSVLGVKPLLGRPFTTQEGIGAGAASVVVISHGLWKRRFAGDADIVGKKVKLGARPFTIIGVAPPGFGGLFIRNMDAWVPLALQAQVIPERDLLHDRTDNSLLIYGRLKPGLTMEKAQADLTVLAGQLAQMYPETNRRRSVQVAPGGRLIEADSNLVPILAPVFVAVGLVLVIACANVANLLLARATVRQREIAVRLSLGASRARLVAQLLTESMVLALAGGALGLLTSYWAIDVVYLAAIRSIPPEWGTYALQITPDLRVFAFALLLSVFTGVLFGLGPALQATRADLTPALKQERTCTQRSRRWSGPQGSLVVVQVALCLVLLIVSGLLVRGLRRIQWIGPGFQANDVVLTLSSIEMRGYDRARAVEFQRRLLERIALLPGVRSASLSMNVPLNGGIRTVAIRREGEVPTEAPLMAQYNLVTAKFLETLSIPLQRGRSFDELESKGERSAVIVSAATAKRLWPEEEPIGKSLVIGAPATAAVRKADPAPFIASAQVVGVARDIRSAILWKEDEIQIYLPLLPAADHIHTSLLARTDPKSPAAMRAFMNDVKAATRALDAELPVSVGELSEVLDLYLLPSRALAWLSAALAGLAMLLSSIGIYGVTAYTVSQRTREIGIRMTFGAQKNDVLKLVLGQSGRLVATGVLFGWAGASGAARLIGGLLYGVTPMDPLTFAGLAALLAGVALLAAYTPARRATAVDPMVALRYE